MQKTAVEELNSSDLMKNFVVLGVHVCGFFFHLKNPVLCMYMYMYITQTPLSKLKQPLF